ncbi:MAG: MBL fold metallo-hydrolase [Acidobacteria bacterium]|nr:MBL fold metallo-hydrolase [Acidobacteriota bacterium]
MNTELLYLKPNVVVEPLFDQWYAWSHLIPPATASRNITERHLEIIDSYIDAPELHAAAVRDPKMLGGPFIDYGGQRVDEIRHLGEKTITERACLIELSKAITQLDGMLRAEAKGFSLQPLYARVPEPLRGYVELVYDLNNYPSFRVLESLLYRSTYYDRSAQSLALSLISSDDRPFVLSTPRLECPDTIELRTPFDSDLVDWLFRTKYSPAPWCKIRECLSVPHSKTELLRSLFTHEPPKPYKPYTGNGIRWRYFGHACILIEAAGVSMLFDPVLSYTYDSQISRYTYEDLPERIDFVLITHNHQDHVLFETLLQIRHKVGAVVVPPGGSGALQDPSLKLLLKQVGFSSVLELAEMESIPFGNGSITGLPFLGEHSDLNIRSKLAYLVRIGQHSLLFGADSCNIDPALYAHVHREIGDVSALFLGMECDGAPLSWLYGPLLTKKIDRAMDQSRRLAGSNYEQAIDIVNRFHCREVYVYAMGQEPWLNYIMSLKYTKDSRPIVHSNRLIEECRARGINAERLFGEREILLSSAAGV